MPTYEYKCEKCSHIFEKFQGINDDPERTCPKCSGSVRRVIHGGAGLVFKGSGFYITDSRNGKSASAAESSSAPPCKDPGKPCAKSCPAANN